MAQPKSNRNDAARRQRRATHIATSRIWRSNKRRYSDRVADLIDAYMTGADALTLRDVLYLELASHEEMRDRCDQSPRDAAALTPVMLQSRKHMRMILQDIGDTGDVDTRPVRVPEGLRVLPSPDEGDDLL